MTSQLQVLKETRVPRENHCLTPSGVFTTKHADDKFRAYVPHTSIKAHLFTLINYEWTFQISHSEIIHMICPDQLCIRL